MSSPSLVPRDAALPPGIRLRRLPGGGALGRWLSTELGSVFQPLVSSGEDVVVAHEAFVRAHGGGEMSLSPWSLFSLVADDIALVSLDRLCRTVHVLNFGQRPGKLFLNVHGRLLAAVSEDHGHAFRRVLDALELKPIQFVIETPESANPDRKLLAFVLANYRLNGFGVAVNVGSLPELEELVRVVRPDYVKLDGRHLRQPGQMEAAIRLVREHGIRPVFIRVEDEAQLDFLHAQPQVLIQGWAVDRRLAGTATIAAGPAVPSATHLEPLGVSA